MNSLYKSYDMNVESAYIIRIKDNERSEKLAERCANSCEQVKMPYKFWDAYNGIKYPIIVPDNLKNNLIMNMMKLSDHYMVRGEVACFLSHLSLWARCLEIERPIVILEHDAIMLQPYLNHHVYNSVCYLGCDEQVKQGWPVYPTPPHGTAGPNYHFILRSHAYAIDPAVARHLVSHVLRFGISSSLDTYINADIFPIHQVGVYAYDEAGDRTDSTILHRSDNGRPSILNEDLLK